MNYLPASLRAPDSIPKRVVHAVLFEEDAFLPREGESICGVMSSDWVARQEKEQVTCKTCLGRLKQAEQMQ